ncbi:MAG: G8 domain-containing protein [Pseudomonadota bacterium]
MKKVGVERLRFFLIGLTLSALCGCGASGTTNEPLPDAESTTLDTRAGSDQSSTTGADQVADTSANEAVGTGMDRDPDNGVAPDTGTPVGQGHSGHHCMMIPDFASADLATHTAAQSGAWSEASTWGGSMPDTGARVLIPEGIIVTLNQVLNSRLKLVRIDGTLAFDTQQNTRLRVDTLYSACSGTLQIGTAQNPVASGVKAEVEFIDEGPVSDAKRLSRGAILAGRTTIYGTPKTHRSIISPQAQQGDTVLNLTTAPSGWALGDQLVVTGTMPNDPTSDELRTISQINQTIVSLDAPLNLDHTAPRADLNVYVANVSRNVEFRSENTDIAHRGHVMLMSADVAIHHARFTELGRTDKTRPLDDVEFIFDDPDSSGDDAPAAANVVQLGGSNIRGRYAIHFHQIGTQPNSAAALVKGSVVFNGPGWGFVNHSSHVNFIDNVSYGLQGAGFYTEAGDEIGRMEGNIAIRSVNSSFTLDDQGAIDPDLRASHMDYGHDGDGFWLTGTRVSLINNVSAGASAHGIIYWTDGIMEPTSGWTTRVSIPVAHLPNGNLIPNRESVPVWWAPMAESRGNESYGATVGFRIRYIHAKNYLGRDDQTDFHRSPPQDYIETLTPNVNELTVWGSRDGVLLNYNERMSLLGAKIVGFGRDVSEFSFNEGTAKSGIGLDLSNDSTHGPGRVENVSIEGFGMAFASPVNSAWQIRDMQLTSNGTDLLFVEPESAATTIVFYNLSYESFTIHDQEDATEFPGHVSVINSP